MASCFLKANRENNLLLKCVSNLKLSWKWHPIMFATFSWLEARWSSCPYSRGGPQKVWIAGGRNHGVNPESLYCILESVRFPWPCLNSSKLLFSSWDLAVFLGISLESRDQNISLLSQADSYLIDAPSVSDQMKTQKYKWGEVRLWQFCWRLEY